MNIRPVILVIALVWTLSSCSGVETNHYVLEPNHYDLEPRHGLEAEVIIVGAGISGLSAAVEMGRAGVEVLVVDMNSVPGGHAVLAGGFAIAATPMQLQDGYKDSPELAYEDWMAWTDGGNPQWTRYYAENSRDMIYDWLTEMGVNWLAVLAIGHENSVPRFHFSEHGAFGVVRTLMRTALALPNVRFLYNHRVEHLGVKERRVAGVEIVNTRTGEQRTLQSKNVVLATGGFEGNLDKVIAHWAPDLPRPERLLIGASIHARGLGLDLAREAGASLTNLDRRYLYFDGTPDPRDPDGVFSVTVRNRHAMWVNTEGKRFTNEAGPDKDIIADVLEQETATYWAIFDEPGRSGVTMLGVEWIHTQMEGHPLLDDGTITIQAGTPKVLAELIGVPAETLAASVHRYNEMIDDGEDTDFTRFTRQVPPPPKIEQGPFYAIQFFPTTRKSMGGVKIDMQGRALDDQGNVVPGLYAIGELTGSAGINGNHGMAGMFLGPGVVTGRIVGRAIAASHDDNRRSVVLPEAMREDPLPHPNHWEPTLNVDNLKALLSVPRDGYWHFQRSHELVLEREYECTRCHSAKTPFYSINNRTSKLAQLESCSNCHGQWPL